MKVTAFLLLLTFFAVAQGRLCQYGSQKNPGYSCSDILRRCGSSRDGVYWVNLKSSQAKPFPVFCDMDAGGWTLIFKAVAGVPGTMSQIWTLRYPMYEYSLGALNRENHFKHHYKNRIVQNWRKFNPEQARLVLYKRAKEELVLRFNARNSNNMNWFSMSNLQESPWVDIASKGKNVFAVNAGHCHGGLCRNFHINHVYPGCAGDVGWLSLGNTRSCKWEKRLPVPSFLYSKTDKAINYNNIGEVGVAEVFSVYLR